MRRLFKEEVCMKKYVPLIALALTLSLSTSAFAMEVPTDTPSMMHSLPWRNP